MDARGSANGNNLHVRLMGIEGSLRPVATYLNGIPLPFFERFLFGDR